MLTFNFVNKTTKDIRNKINLAEDKFKEKFLQFKKYYHSAKPTPNAYTVKLPDSLKLVSVEDIARRDDISCFKYSLDSMSRKLIYYTATLVNQKEKVQFRQPRVEVNYAEECKTRRDVNIGKHYVPRPEYTSRDVFWHPSHENLGK